jgi:ribonuclease G
MPITLLVSRYKDLHRVAYLKDGRAIDVDLEYSPAHIPSFSPLDQIYWGRVVRVAPTHAFVKLTENQVGLLPFEHPFSQPIEGERLLVQVRREAIPDKGTLHKGSLLTRKIIFGGRYCLYHPFQEKRVLSSKIQDPATRNHLQKLVPAYEPITLRESAAQAPFDEIHAEIAALRQKYAEISPLSPQAPCSTPYDAMPSSHRWMRDLEAHEGNKILVDDDLALINIRNFLKAHRPDLLPYVQKHNHPLFETYGLDDFWESLFEDVVLVPNGGNIVIDVTAAVIAIDINQGDQDACKTNAEAIPIIVHHLKGRHLGGNIIIDFIGLQTYPHDRDKLTRLLLKEASYYNLPFDIFGWSKLGWMEVRLPKRRVPIREMVNLLGR